MIMDPVTQATPLYRTQKAITPTIMKKLQNIICQIMTYITGQYSLPQEKETLAMESNTSDSG